MAQSVRISKPALAGLVFALSLGVGACTFDTPNVPTFGTEKTAIAPPSDYGSPDQSGSDTCGAMSYAGLIGEKWPGESVALPDGARVIHPGVMVTQDYLPNRLNIHIDENGNVFRVVCG